MDVCPRFSSGKSSLLSALLGGMQKRAGVVYVPAVMGEGGCGYAAQDAWVRHGSLLDNIVFGRCVEGGGGGGGAIHVCGGLLYMRP